MLDFNNKLSNSKQSVFIIILVLCIAITFETFQQLYYIKRFNLANDVTFLYVLKNQAFKWFVWIILSAVLVFYVKVKSSKIISYPGLLKLALVILGLVFFNIIIISIIQWYFSGDNFTLSTFTNDYFQFFTFQKAPIYTLGYIAIAIIMHFYYANEELQVKVEKLSELKKTNNNLYQQLSKYNDDKTSVLNIKIGNKRKIIPVTDIYWIEADDYCVKVHTNKDSCYTMRSTLKALDSKLSNNFLRIHRKAIANMDMVKELNLSNTPKLVLNNNTEIPISKSNLKMVKNFIE